MKLKKKEFDRLIKIVYSVSYFDGIDEIKEILAKVGMRYENKPKTVEEKPLNKTAAFLEVCAKHQEEFYANYLKQSEYMVAASTDKTPFTRGLRDAVESIPEQKVDFGSYVAYLKREKKAELVYNLHFSGFPTPELTSVTVLKADHSDYHQELLSDVILYRRVDDTINPEVGTEPKVGDVGYFWMVDTDYICFGKIREIHPTRFRIEHGTYFPNFSKTPPELK